MRLVGESGHIGAGYGRLLAQPQSSFSGVQM
jgi:hypothetical protein